MDVIKRFGYLSLILFVFNFSSCGSSIEDDVEQAVKYTEESLIHISNKDLKKSEQLFNKARLIREKYIENLEAFDTLYISVLEEKKENNK